LWTIKLRQTERDKILDALLRKDENFLDNSCYLKGNETRYYICSSIRIKYKGYSFIWQDWDWVDMIDIYDEITCWDKGVKLANEGNKELGEKYKYLHFHFPDSIEKAQYINDEGEQVECFFDSPESLIRELDRCISEYEKIKKIKV
jgi:hypothetical protein